MPDEDNKRRTDDDLARSVEFEMATKRAEWQRNRDRFRNVRMFGFSFLSLVIVGAVIALLAVFNRANEVRQQRETLSPSPTISPQSAPPR